MRNTTYAALVSVLAAAAAPNAARAGTGACVLQGLSNAQATVVLSGTYGLTGQGVVTATNQLQIPAGNFSHEGTVTLSGGVLASNRYISNFSMNVTEINAGNVSVSRNYNGMLSVNTSNCTGTVTLPSYGIVGFVLTFVNGGDGLRMSAVVPGVFVTYATAQKE